MFITTSKNADKKSIMFAKELCRYIPTLEYMGRSRRSLERMCTLVRREGGDRLLILSKNQIKKYCLTEEGWFWADECLELSDVNMLDLPDMDEESPPIRVSANTDAAKKLADYLGIIDDVQAGIYDEHTELKLIVQKEHAKISVGRKEAIDFRLGWESV